jgi:hypothetical protein
MYAVLCHSVANAVPLCRKSVAILSQMRCHTVANVVPNRRKCGAKPSQLQCQIVANVVPIVAKTVPYCRQCGAIPSPMRCSSDGAPTDFWRYKGFVSRGQTIPIFSANFATSRIANHVTTKSMIPTVHLYWTHWTPRPELWLKQKKHRVGGPGGGGGREVFRGVQPESTQRG